MGLPLPGGPVSSGLRHKPGGPWDHSPRSSSGNLRQNRQQFCPFPCGPSSRARLGLE